MRIGIFGPGADPQTQALVRELERLGAQGVLIDSDALEQGEALSFADSSVHFRSECMDGVRCFFVRLMPQSYAPELQQTLELRLHEDWFTLHMQARERASALVSWMLQLGLNGVALVNPPEAASKLLYKPFQLHVLREAGVAVPHTLLSNEPERVRAFLGSHGEVLFTSLLGEGRWRVLDAEAGRRLEALRHTPALFLARVRGEHLRAVLVGDEVVSCVAGAGLESPELLEASSHEVALPGEVVEQCRRVARSCGLSYAGFSLTHTGGRYLFHGVDSSPEYHGVEAKLGVRITEALARHLVAQAQAASERRPA